ncbi:MAG: hypothetical protein WC868_06515 [Bacteroidales bacterium]
MKKTIAVLSILFYTSTFAQDKKDTINSMSIWLNGGIIFATDSSLSYKIDLDFKESKFVYTLSFHDHTQLVFFDYAERRLYYSFLFGYINSSDYNKSSISVGFSDAKVVYGDIIGQTGSSFWPTYIYHYRPVNYFGMALKVQTIFYYKFIGIGLSVEANINKRRSFIGAGINISIGKIS